MDKFEYWDLDSVRMSDRALGDVLRTVIRLGGKITDSYVPGLTTLEKCVEMDKRKEKRIFSTNCAMLRLALPVDVRTRFERMTGFALQKPPKAFSGFNRARGWFDDEGNPVYLGEFI